MPKLLLIIPLMITLLFYFLSKKNDRSSFIKSGKVFVAAIVVVFLLWLFLPMYLFGTEQEKYVSEILNKTGIPPTIAKIIATLLAIVYVAVIWLGDWKVRPMNFVYAIAIPPIIVLSLQFFFPNIAKSCKAINPRTGKYEFCECDYPDKIHPTWGTPVLKNDGILTPIFADEKTVLIDKTGRGLFFYTEDKNGEIYLFDQEGYTPTGDKTKSITPEIAKKYIAQIKARPQMQINYHPNSGTKKENADLNSTNIKTKTHYPSTNIPSTPSTSKNEMIQVSKNISSDYLIVSQNINKVEGLLNEIQNVIELKGSSSKISNDQSITASTVKGQYKKILTINGNLYSKNSSIDQTALSTTYIYTVKIYNAETSTLLNSASDKISVVGFSEFENLEKIKQSVSLKIKSLL